MPSELPRITVRIDKEAIETLREMAEKNERSLNQEICYALKQYIKNSKNETP